MNVPLHHQVRSQDEDVELGCPKCQSEDFERIMSCTNFAMSEGSAKPSGSTENRTCSSGSCTTWNLPGHGN